MLQRRASDGVSPAGFGPRRTNNIRLGAITWSPPIEARQPFLRTFALSALLDTASITASIAVEMRRAASEFLTGNAVGWLVLVLLVFIVSGVSWFGHSTASEVLRIGAVLVLLVFLGLRSLISRELDIGSVVVAIWLLAFLVLEISETLRPLAILVLVAASISISILFIRRRWF